MKKKLSAFIIGAAIWFGMADAARQMDYLQTEASDLIAKSSIYLFSFGRENTPVPTEGLTVVPYILSTDNALAAETKPRGVAPENALANKKAKVRRTTDVTNHSIEQTAKKAKVKIITEDLNGMIALSDKLEAEVHTHTELNKGETANWTPLNDIEIKQREGFLRKVAVVQEIVSEFAKEYDGEFYSEPEVNVILAPSPVESQQLPCPTTVSPDRNNTKTVLLVPEVFRQFGE